VQAALTRWTAQFIEVIGLCASSARGNADPCERRLLDGQGFAHRHDQLRAR
jgi:hypothetical protein